MNIIYRKATIEDKKSLFHLAVLFTEFNAKSSGDHKKFFWDDWEKDFDEEITNDLNHPLSVYFIAELEDKTPVGYVLARSCNNCNYFIIDELFIKDDMRGNNVGQKLLEMAIAEGKKHHNTIRVEIFGWNEHAKRFYLRHGFKEDSIVLEL